MLILFMLLGGLHLHSQTSTTIGKEFYFNYLPNQGLDSDYKMSVSITSDVTTSGSLEVIGTGYTQNFTVNANTTLKLDVPSQFKIDEYGAIQQKVVYISTLEDVTAYAYNEFEKSSDGSMLLPIESLDKEYIITVWRRDAGSLDNSKTQFSVLATTDDTPVEITFSSNVMDGNTLLFQQGETIERTMQRGEVIAFASTTDLTGTEVKVIDDGTINCKKIAVFAGNDELGTDNASGAETTDHTFNQLYAIRDWGKEYFIVLHETRFRSDPVLVVASEDNTTVEISAVPPQTLNKGQAFPFFADVEHYIRADKPISVVHLTSSSNNDLADRGNSNADPFMMVLSPLKQTSNDIVFNIFDSETIIQNYLSIVTTTQRLDMRLDGVDISSQFEVISLAEEYSMAVVEIEPGAHRLESRSGAVAHAYGFGEEEGIGYAVGGDLGEFEIDVRNVGSGLPVGEVCVNDDFELSVSAENEILTALYTSYQWDMGDGTILEGPTVTYRYDSPGDYTITLFASKSELACSDLNVSRNMEVMDAAIESIAGPSVICPNVGEVSYELTGSEPDYTYQWFVEGGTVQSSDGPSASVLWSGGGTKELKAVSTSPIGCVSDTVRLAVEFKPELEPITPLGPSSVCGDFTGIEYYVPRTNGSVYSWSAHGGTVVEGQGTERVIIDWDGPGNHSVWYTELSTTQTDLCEGTAISLRVIVSEQIDIEITTQPVTCYDQNDGAATVNVSGGVGPYSVRWSTGSTQNTISGLGGGRYEVSITDGVGCQVTREVEIFEPTELAGIVQVQNPSCSGNNGVATAVVSGGTGTLSYLWDHDFTTNHVRTGLGEGTYSVRVRDEVGCELTLNFSVSEPQPLQVRFEHERPCPDQAVGSLSLFVDGGTAPYEYRWQHDPSLNSDLAEGLAGGDYQVQIVDAEGCNITLTESLINLAPRIVMPTAFSPNGDGDNDEFKAVFSCPVNFQMYIYNQWGTLVFGSTDIATGWNGTYEGEPVPTGEYAYHIIYDAGPNGDYKESVRGQIMLIR